MPKFKVVIAEVWYRTSIVEAESEQDAIETMHGYPIGNVLEESTEYSHMLEYDEGDGENISVERIDDA
jgi:hypothetical protein